MAETIILGVDPSLRGTGFGIVATSNGKQKALAYGVISNAPALSQEACLLKIHTTLQEVISRFKPECMAVENTIYVQSYQTAIVLGAARGAALLAAARAGVPVFNYAPKRVKQAVVGKGAAGKDQVGFMIRVLLGLQEVPPSDAADALAIALTHIQSAGAPRPPAFAAKKTGRQGALSRKKAAWSALLKGTEGE